MKRHLTGLQTGGMFSATDIAAQLFDALFPRRCGFCGTPGPVVCNGCFNDLPHNNPACRRCAKPLAIDGVCGACQQSAPPFACVVAPMRYAYPVDAAIRAFKYRHQEIRLPSLLHLMRQGLRDLPTDVDAVVAMPMHWRRRVQRGFNQAALLAAPIAQELGVPLLDAVAKTRHTPPQSTLAGPARRRNLADAFRCVDALSIRHVLIVDDVYTTGQSAAHLTRVLRKAGVEQVSLLVIARASQARL
ncbi:MAG: ComF family protein [Pseudomonadota bacterium]